MRKPYSNIVNLRCFACCLVCCISFLVFGVITQGFAKAGTTQPSLESSNKANEPLYSKSYALVIGVNEPQGEWAPLKSAQQDAQMFADHLKNRGFEVTLLLGNDANKKEILKQLQTKLPQKVKAGDRFIFYFAGHGQTQTLSQGKKVGYIVPADGIQKASEDEWHTYLSMRELRSLLTDYIVSKHTLLVFDSCFSGLMFTRGGLRRPNLNARSYLKRNGVMAITAGGEGELALDGLFTPTLIQALSGEADENADGMTSFQELALYTRREVKARQDQQNPQFGVISGSGQMIFDSKESWDSKALSSVQDQKLSAQLRASPANAIGAHPIWTATAISSGLLTLAGAGLMLYAREQYVGFNDLSDSEYNERLDTEGNNIIFKYNMGIGLLSLGGGALLLSFYKLLNPPQASSPSMQQAQNDAVSVSIVPNLFNQSLNLEMTW